MKIMLVASLAAVLFGVGAGGASSYNCSPSSLLARLLAHLGTTARGNGRVSLRSAASWVGLKSSLFGTSLAYPVERVASPACCWRQVTSRFASVYGREPLRSRTSKSGGFHPSSVER